MHWLWGDETEKRNDACAEGCRGKYIAGYDRKEKWQRRISLYIRRLSVESEKEQGAGAFPAGAHTGTDLRKSGGGISKPR